MLITTRHEDGQTEQVLLSEAIEELISPLLRRVQQALHNNDAEMAHHYADTLAILDRTYEDAKHSERTPDS